MFSNIFLYFLIFSYIFHLFRRSWVTVVYAFSSQDISAMGSETPAVLFKSCPLSLNWAPLDSDWLQALYTFIQIYLGCYDNIHIFTGHTPLLYATLYEQVEVVKTLVEYGVNVNAKDFYG